MFRKLNPLLHSELRLAVMSILIGVEEADFVYIRKQTGATAGNLSVQIDKLSEAAHGTVTRHYYKHLQGEETSTNPIATIFAWSGAFRKRGEMDNIPELVNYADQLEAACFDTLNAGIVTKDLANLMEGVTPQVKNSADFIAAIRERLEKRLA